MKNQLSIKVDTTNTVALGELSLMFSRLAGANMIAISEPQIGLLHDVAELDTVARKNAETKDSQAEYVAVQEEVMSTAPESINPTVAFGGSVPPPPVADAPVFTETMTHVPVGELDSEGMPWNARIHSAAKTKVANGTWKLFRGVDQELVKAIKAEYLGNAVSTPTQNSAPIAKPPVEAIIESITPSGVVVGAVPPPPVATGGMSYEQAIEHLISVNKVPVNIIQGRCITNGIPSFQLLAQPEYAHLIDNVVRESITENEKRLLGASNG